MRGCLSILLTRSTRDEAKRVTFEYIEVFYNRIRRHAKLKNQIPAEFAKTYMQNTEKNAA